MILTKATIKYQIGYRIYIFFKNRKWTECSPDINPSNYLLKEIVQIQYLLINIHYTY